MDVAEAWNTEDECDTWTRKVCTLSKQKDKTVFEKVIAELSQLACDRSYIKVVFDIQHKMSVINLFHVKYECRQES